MELKLERAGMLVSGLAGEKARWEETVKVRSLIAMASLLLGPPFQEVHPSFSLRNGQGKTRLMDVGTPRIGRWVFFLPPPHICVNVEERHFVH
jgi:hypothetical protein